MNKISRNYKPKLNLKETQKVCDFIEHKLCTILGDKLDLIKVKGPVISSIRQSTETYNTAASRTVNYDSIMNEGIFHLINKYNYWLTNTIKRLEIKNNKGILVLTNYIDRDKQLSNVSSMENNILQIEYRFDNLEKIYDKMSELVDLVYNSIYLIFESVKHNYKILKHLIPIKLKEVSEKNKKHIIFQDNIEKNSLENGIFKSKNSIPEEEYNLDVSNDRRRIQIWGYSKYGQQAMKLVEGVIRPDYNFLKKSEFLSNTLIEEINFADKILDKGTYRTFNLQIDLDALSMFITDKAHILEIQSGVYSENIEKIFKQKEIKRL